MSSTIASRLREIIEKTTSKHRRNKELENLSGVDAERWSAFMLNRQRATSEMIEGIAKAYPTLCLWLCTGLDDKANSQYDVDTYLALKAYSIADLLKKEPMDLTADEMKVIDAEDARWRGASRIDSSRMDYSNFVMIYEAREHRMSRQQVLEKWYEEQDRVLTEAYKDHQKNDN